MGYEVAISKAWEELKKLKPSGELRVKFFHEEYSLDPQTLKVIALSTNAPAKPFVAILILHYLMQALKGLPGLTGEWLTFRELSGVEGYAEAFRKRCIEPLIKRYGNNSQALLSKPGTQKAEGADAAVIIEAFKGVPALIKVWKADSEFGADANIYFDRSILQIFCTEDIVVLAGFIAGKI